MVRSSNPINVEQHPDLNPGGCRRPPQFGHIVSVVDGDSYIDRELELGRSVGFLPADDLVGDQDIGHAGHS